MTDADLITALRARIDEASLTQLAVAKACGMTQPHLSKLLSGKAPFGKKAKANVAAWLQEGGDRSARPLSANIDAIVNRLSAGSPDKAMHFMHLLQALDALIP